VSRLSRTLISLLGAFTLGAIGLALPSPAAAATTPTIIEVGDGYLFTGGAENNNVTVSIVSGRVRVHDANAASFGFIGANCVSVPVGVGAAVSCKRKSPTIFHADLGDGDDSVNGSSLPQLVRLDVRTGDGNNVVFGSAGNDILRGQSSATGGDVLQGGNGNDRLTAGTGAASIDGGNGNDIIVGGPGADLISGGAGNDGVRSDGGVDQIFGGAGNDSLTGDGDNDVIDGQAGNDIVIGGAGDDTLTGGVGRDAFQGNEGDDAINSVDNARDGGDCGAGNDVLSSDAPTSFLGLPTGGDATAFNNCETINQF
jgi:Ca2+-binding RTX toxin-like protein